MHINEAVVTLQNLVDRHYHTSFQEAFDCIKKEFVEVKKPSHNTVSTPLCNCEQLFIGCAITGTNCKTHGASICK